MQGDELKPPIMLEDMLEAVNELQRILAINRLTLWYEQIKMELKGEIDKLAQKRITDALIAIELAMSELDKVQSHIEKLKDLNHGKMDKFHQRK